MSVLASNEFYEALIQKGVELTPDETIKLPRPVLGDGMDQLHQQRGIESILGGKYDWETFTRKAVVGPFVLKITDDGRSRGGSAGGSICIS